MQKKFKPLPQLPKNVTNNKDDDADDFLEETKAAAVEPKKSIRSIKVNSDSVVDMNNTIFNEEIIIESGHQENEWDVYFRELEKYEKQFGKVVLLYQIGEFYEIYGVDNETESIGRIWEIAEAAGLNFSKVGISKYPNIHENDRKEHPLKGGFQLNSYYDKVPKLLKNGFTVVEIIQSGKTNILTDSAGKNKKEKKERKLLRIITPSTFIDEIDESGSSYTASIFIGIHTRESQKAQIKQKGWKECVFSIGMSALDWSTNGRDGVVYEAHDKSYDSTYSMNELYRFLHSLSPKEIIITYNSSFKFDEEPTEEDGNIELTEESFFDFLNKELGLKNFTVSSMKQITKEYTNINYQIALLERVFPNHNMVPVIDYLDLNMKEHAIASFAQLLQFAYDRDSKILNGLEKPQLWESDKHLILSNNALYQLHVVGSKSDDGHNEQQGLYDIINKTKTPMGKRLLRYDVLNPIVDPSELETRYQVVSMLKQNNIFNDIRKFLGYMSDIEKLYRHIELGMIRPNMLAKLNATHEEILLMINWMKQKEELKDLWKIDAEYIVTNEIINKLSSFINKFNSLFDIEKMQTCSQINKVEESFFKVGCGFDEIDKLQEEINDNKDSLGTFTAILSKLIDPDAKNEAISIKKLATNAKTKREIFALNCSKPRFRLIDHYLKAIEVCPPNSKKMVFRYESARAFDKLSKRTDDEDATEIKKPGKNDPILSDKEIMYLQSICEINREKLKTNVQFQSSCLNESKDIATDLYIQMNEAMKKAYKEILILFTQEYIPYCHILSQFISRLDVFSNHAFTATEFNYTKPIISTHQEFCHKYPEGSLANDDTNSIDASLSEERSFIKAKNVRHPIIERLLSRTTFVPNDVTIGCENTNGILLFGINNVGKTSYLRSVGLNILMAQIGSFVPADQFTYYPFFNILTRLSGGDNMHKGQGIFEVEMSELRDITHRCSFRSIVLADELCHGTEQVSANSLVTGGIGYLSKRTNFILATHLHDTPKQPELQTLQNIKCFHLKITRDPKTNRITYNRTLQEGSGDSNYGIEVARAMGIPDEILLIAESVRKRYLDEESNIVSMKTSRYSSNVHMKSCMNCGKRSQDTHHIIEQSEADENGFINHFHKNTPANLLPLCKECHNKVTYGKLEILPPVMTTEGIVIPISETAKNI
jgi:DNA mismatch repair protein MutS